MQRLLRSHLTKPFHPSIDRRDEPTNAYHIRYRGSMADGTPMTAQWSNCKARGGTIIGASGGMNQVGARPGPELEGVESWRLGLGLSLRPTQSLA
jgi:hypothetical protein